MISILPAGAGMPPVVRSFPNQQVIPGPRNYAAPKQQVMDPTAYNAGGFKGGGGLRPGSNTVQTSTYDPGGSGGYSPGGITTAAVPIVGGIQPVTYTQQPQKPPTVTNQVKPGTTKLPSLPGLVEQWNGQVPNWNNAPNPGQVFQQAQLPPAPKLPTLQGLVGQWNAQTPNWDNAPRPSEIYQQLNQPPQAPTPEMQRQLQDALAQRGNPRPPPPPEAIKQQLNFQPVVQDPQQSTRKFDLGFGAPITNSSLPTPNLGNLNRNSNTPYYLPLNGTGSRPWGVR